MNKNSKCFAGYWRNSLVDAIFAKGGLNQEDIRAFIECDSLVWKTGRVSDEITTKLFKNESNDSKTVAVVLRPKVYHNKTEHTFAKKDTPEFIVPLVTSALLARNGQLYPFKNETIISRDILEPLAQGSFSIGSIDSLDSALTSNIVLGIDYSENEKGYSELTEEEYELAWKAYLKNSELLLKAVAKDWLENSNTFELSNYGYIIKKDVVKSAVMHIVPLYDKLRESSESTLLFDNFASKLSSPKQPCLPSNSFFSKRLAHSGDEFPLADAQRDALSHVLNSENGEILAVNGPPGTGKTTMLLSVVASLWSKSALEESEPPVIVAASTNNQAVTNVIDAFGKDFSIGNGVFSGRWLPDVNSFGAYYPSQGKAEKASEMYQTETFFNKIETREYFEKAKPHYIFCAQQAFPKLAFGHCTVKDIVAKLHQELKKEVDKLECIEKAWGNVSDIYQKIQEHLGELPSQKQNNYEQQLQTDEVTKNIWENLETSWQEYLASESIWYAIFSWVPPVTQKRLLKANLYLNKMWPTGQTLQQWETINSVSVFIKDKINSLDQSIQKNKKEIQAIEYLFSQLKKYLDEWKVTLKSLDIVDGASAMTLAQVDSLCDTKIRFNIFLLTTHYWEGRWLMDMEALLPTLDEWKRKNGRIPTEKRWHLRMKLTPCIVSTFYILPAKFIYIGAECVKNYLYNFADLLIVDEAGQVLPEVAAASFSLSKKALVIGDTLQIEPIWSIPSKVDIGNLQASQVICDTDVEKEYERLKELGKTAASGSVMKIAQQASKYHYDLDMEPGMFLYEHRRCYDEIISYCNTLVYKGKLKPMRGISSKKSLFPALGYLHIDGICQQTSSGSRCNKLEAKVIAKWLIENKAKLEKKYQEPIHKIVGIVTPFGEQVTEIKKAIREAESNINVNDGEDVLTVGTVHSLQGAERKVIIFSTVYSKHANGNFIDNQSSILNVAVSRAKDSFFVFGDMDILNPALETPRGMLAKFLFAEDSNELCFEYIARDDLVKSNNANFLLLKDAQEHDIFLLDVVKKTQKEVIIVSPWVKLVAIEHINILPVMEMAVKKGVKVLVYTDLELNSVCNNKEKSEVLKSELINIKSKLENKGIEIRFIKKVHSKLVIKDNDLLCVGSFNWLSAQRVGNYVRHETSIVYQGNSDNLVNEINLLKESFADRLLSLI